MNPSAKTEHKQEEEEEEEEEEIDHEFLPLLRVYRNGRVERLIDTDTVPPSLDPLTGVSSEDVLIDPHTGAAARLYLPPLTATARLPILFYIHGGAFCLSSPFTPKYHNYLNSVVSHSNLLAVSISYRLAPEHPLPAAYNDSFAALKWLDCHSHDHPWLIHHADFTRVFISGDSAGANIAHNLALTVCTY